MTDEWFSAFVYQIVADRKYISKELIDVFDHGEATVLPPWVSGPPGRRVCGWIVDVPAFAQDPMGTLA